MVQKLLTLATAFSITSIALMGCHPQAMADSPISTMTPEGQIEQAFSIQGGMNDVNNHRGGKLMKKRWAKLMKELNLTEEQKQAFTQMHRDMKQRFQGNRGKRKAVIASLKNEFLSHNLDKFVVKSKIEQMTSDIDPMLDQVAQNIVKGYQVLTVEQRALIEQKMAKRKAKRAQRTEKMGKFHQKFQGKMLKRMTKNLQLTPEQQTKMEAIFDSTLPNRQAMRAQKQAIHTAIKNELKAGADVEKIKGILKQAKNKHEGKLDLMVDKMAQVHALLTPEQRQKLVKKIDKFPMFGGKHRKHHRFGNSHF